MNTIERKEWEFNAAILTTFVDSREAPRRPQGDHCARRWRPVGIGETTAGRDADPRAGAGASLEADAGGGEVSIGWELAEAEGVTRSFVNPSRHSLRSNEAYCRRPRATPPSRGRLFALESVRS
jgi:hypothetical protein